MSPDSPIPDQLTEPEEVPGGASSFQGATSANAEHAALYVAEMTVRGFRGLGECKIEFEPDLTLLVGRNNSGKSRILRALAVGLGEVPADRDDWTKGGTEEASIDIVLAPRVSADMDDEFDKRVIQRLQDVQPLSDEPVRERFAWRTIIRVSAEGFGVRADHFVLVFDQSTQAWQPHPGELQLSRGQRTIVACDLIDSRRDLMDDLTRRGSAIRRILDDLEVPPERRQQLEADLETLGEAIVADSASLASVQTKLDALSQHVETVGKASINPVPGRLEELSRTVSIEFDTGGGDLPIRFHGAGARSLAALQTQGVLYERRLGRDGLALLPHPVSLIEEPEAHLHPQAQFDLAVLLGSLLGQVVVSTHSSHLVSVVEARAIRLIQPEGSRVIVKDLRPSQAGTPTVVGDALNKEDMEKLLRMVERPFGELLFASAVVIGDGASERALLPSLIRHRLGVRSHGVCVVDPGSMNQPYATAVVKLANRVGLPWLLFADSDASGKEAAERLVHDHGQGDMTHVVWMSISSDVDTEQMLVDFDRTLCEDACGPLGFQPGEDVKRFMVLHKGAYGRLVAAELLTQRPWPDDDNPSSDYWPTPVTELIAKLDNLLPKRLIDAD